MRTNVHLDDDLLREARKHSRAKTKRALIEEALATFIEVKKEREATRRYAERVQNLQKRLSALRLRDRPFDVLRQDRSR